jgi:ABC-2 type transport system permease protein
VKKIFHVAGREFLATVMTKGFVFGVLITPAIIAAMIYLMPRLITKAPPKMAGRVVVADPTGQVAGTLRWYLAPEQFAERRAKERRKIEEKTPEPVRRQVAASPAGDAAMRQSLDAAMGQVPHIQVDALPEGGDLEASKAPLKSALPKNESNDATVLALVVLHPDAVRRAEGQEKFGTYDLFVRPKLDDRLVDDIHDGMREAIIAARLGAAGIEPSRIKGLTDVEKPTSRTVSAEGEQATNEVLNTLLPAAFMVLLLVSVLTSGQYLLTSTVEEKSNRVVEVLLSAVSPMELMTGKILGQMAVGFLVLLLYAGLGLLALISFATVGLLDPMLLVYLLVFFVLAFFTTASMMAAIGSAVNEMREAQTLMAPVMMFLMIPWLLWLPISRDPNSTLAVVLSFIPPIGNFVMLLRMTSTAPPPAWQAWLAIAVNAAGVYASVWFAAKVFRVGLLMYGKPPSFGTLIKWARMS